MEVRQFPKDKVRCSLEKKKEGRLTQWKTDVHCTSVLLFPHPVSILFSLLLCSINFSILCFSSAYQCHRFGSQWQVLFKFSKAICICCNKIKHYKNVWFCKWNLFKTPPSVLVIAVNGLIYIHHLSHTHCFLHENRSNTQCIVCNVPFFMWHLFWTSFCTCSQSSASLFLPNTCGDFSGKSASWFISSS